MIAIAYTLLFCGLGVLMLRWLMPQKSPLVRAWLGVSLGVLMEMGLPALCANLLDFTIAAHLAAVAAALLLAALCYAAREKAPLAQMREADRRQLAVMAAVGIPLTAFSAYLQYTHCIMPASDGSLWCGQATYGDLCMHLSFITSLENMSFPPSYNLLAGTGLSYPYLTVGLSSSFFMLGMPLNLSLVVPGTLLMALTYAGYMLLAQQILGGRHKAVAVAALLFFFNGGLGFLYDFDLAFTDNFARVREIFTGYYKTPANQPDLNLRFSNVIADLMLPQRALLGGWAMGLPALYLLISSVREKSVRQTAMLALWASALPLVHTHTFLALGLFSGGYLLGSLIEQKEERRGILIRAGLYLGVVLALALPQLMGNAVKQTLEGGSLRFQFNWVNNSGGRGFKDGYFWFWVKNAGLPFILVICACLCAKKRGYLDIVLGMTAIYVVAETILFQPNEYDNNKLFYQGLFMSPVITANAEKTAIFAAKVYERLGFQCHPSADTTRYDIIQAITLGSEEAMVAFCQGIQAAAPIDSFVTPYPDDMPGYDSKVIMAAGAFVQGSSIELSADGPIRAPYNVYFQGGLTWYHGKLGIMMSVQKMLEKGLITI